MAVGDLYISATNRFFVSPSETDILSRTWSQVNAPTRSGVRAMAVARDGTLHIARGTTQSPQIGKLVNNAWVNSSPGRTGLIYGLGIDANGLIYVGVITQIYTIAENSPIISPGLPNDPLTNSRISLQGMSVNQDNGTIAVVSLRNIFELAKGATAWVETVIPSTILNTFARSIQSCTYDHLGGLWIYETIGGRYYHRSHTTEQWTSAFQIPTTINSVSIDRSSIQSSAFDQGRGAVNLIKLGAADINDIKLGTADVAAIYKGERKVWG